MFGMSKPARPKGAKPDPKPPTARPAADDSVSVTIKMSAQQHEKLQRLGGAEWVRERIDKAALPKE
jgi:hypothetical protein